MGLETVRKTHLNPPTRGGYVPILAIQNLRSFNSFADASKGDDLLPPGCEDYIHIIIQQRNGRETFTTVQGIAEELCPSTIKNFFSKEKKKYACKCTIIELPKYGEVIQLEDDQPKNTGQFLLETGLAKGQQGKDRGTPVLPLGRSLPSGVKVRRLEVTAAGLEGDGRLPC
ncbi:eukaryotic translation initiation factor 1-like [Marmota marmota marmota]|uniref:eukaryotic translation initiation factor 1-like n=1 Tax=Marmota marmota marmota TaxID=9994 RepID=UPI00209336EB|nr:eukaryotic translation initiation factor 1-like [Marmota marmota marmota]